jgi:hypothetical protein
MLTKKEQLRWNKPKKKKRSKRITTDEELDYLRWFKEQKFRCFVCGSPNTESHHIKERSSDKKNHYELLPLCWEHHHGSVLSPHGTPHTWRNNFTMEEQREFSKQLRREYVTKY